MWVYLSDSFLSIVAHDFDPTCLLVRARVAGDIERVFPGVKAKRTPGADYLYRAKIPHQRVYKAISRAVLGIDYRNFKGSVADELRHNAYLGCWTAMSRLQQLKDEDAVETMTALGRIPPLSESTPHGRLRSPAPRTRAGAPSGKRAKRARLPARPRPSQSRSPRAR